MSDALHHRAATMDQSSDSQKADLAVRLMANVSARQHETSRPSHHEASKRRA